MLDGSHLGVDAADGERFDQGQKLGRDQPVQAQRLGHGQGGRHIPADDPAGDGAKLAVQGLGQFPDLPSFKRAGAVQISGAGRAWLYTSGAVAFAPAEVPFGKGAEAFPSSARIRPLAT